MLKVSFFSYKGGAGRTSMLYNTVSYLVGVLGATPENPIVLVDLDIDSKGLSYLLKSDLDTEDKLNAIRILKQSDAVTNLFISKDDFFKMMIPVGKAFGLESACFRSVLFVTADTSEMLNVNGNYDGPSVGIENFARRLEKFGCKALVMDNPAGGQLSADVALRISDKIVTVMRITKQFREGTAEFLRKKKNYDNKEYIIVPNAVPSDEGTIYSIDQIMNRIKSSLVAAAEVQHDTVNTRLLDEKGIHEVRLFKFEETNLREKANTDPLEQDEALAAKKYELLAKVIADDE